MDRTQNTGPVDQASIVLRFVKDEEIHEWLFAVIHVIDSTGKGVNEILQAKIEDRGIKYENISRVSFECVTNMRAKFNGFHSHNKNPVPGSVYI